MLGVLAVLPFSLPLTLSFPPLLFLLESPQPSPQPFLEEALILAPSPQRILPPHSSFLPLLEHHLLPTRNSAIIHAYNYIYLDIQKIFIISVVYRIRIFFGHYTTLPLPISYLFCSLNRRFHFLTFLGF